MRQLDYWKSKQKQQQLEDQISKNQAQNEVQVEDLKSYFKQRVLAAGECVYEATLSQSSARTGDGY